MLLRLTRVLILFFLGESITAPVLSRSLLDARVSHIVYEVSLPSFSGSSATVSAANPRISRPPNPLNILLLLLLRDAALSFHYRIVPVFNLVPVLVIALHHLLYLPL